MTVSQSSFSDRTQIPATPTGTSDNKISSGLFGLPLSITSTPSAAAVISYELALVSGSPLILALSRSKPNSES